MLSLIIEKCHISFDCPNPNGFLNQGNVHIHVYNINHIFSFWIIDAAKEDGSIGRLVNDDHLNPNAKMKYLNMQGKPHLCLFATWDINPGEEITYNYGDSDWPWRSRWSYFNVLKLITANKEMWFRWKKSWLHLQCYFIRNEDRSLPVTNMVTH